MRRYLNRDYLRMVGGRLIDFYIPVFGCLFVVVETIVRSLQQ
jgi:hypothetical protein